NNHVYSMFVGYNNGNALILLNLQSSAQSRINLQAAPEDRWAQIKIFDLNGQRMKEVSYLDEYLTVRISQTEPTSYDARNRPWYKMASEGNQLIKTPTYLFSLINLPGVSYAKQSR